MVDPFAQPKWLPAGIWIENFEIKNKIGRGGFGITYHAEEFPTPGSNEPDDLLRTVALKEFFPEGLVYRTANASVFPIDSDEADDDRAGAFAHALKGFIKEARMVMKVESPNVVQIHRVFECNGTAYFAMPLLKGKSLQSKLGKADTMTQDEIEHLLVPLLNGLEAVHQKDIVHRDIKPANIMLREDFGIPVLIDFGASRLSTVDVANQLTKAQVGVAQPGKSRAPYTPGYAPIEQYSHSVGDNTHGPYTDIYAYCATLYRCVTGLVPTEANIRSFEVQVRKRPDPLLPIRSACAVAHRYSCALLSAIDWGLELNPQDRPQSVSELRDVLLGRAAAPVRAVPTTQPPSAETLSPPPPSPPTAREVGADQASSTPPQPSQPRKQAETPPSPRSSEPYLAPTPPLPPAPVAGANHASSTQPQRLQPPKLEEPPAPPSPSSIAPPQQSAQEPPSGPPPPAPPLGGEASTQLRGPSHLARAQEKALLPPLNPPERIRTFIALGALLAAILLAGFIMYFKGKSTEGVWSPKVVEPKKEVLVAPPIVAPPKPVEPELPAPIAEAKKQGVKALWALAAARPELDPQVTRVVESVYRSALESFKKQTWNDDNSAFMERLFTQLQKQRDNSVQFVFEYSTGRFGARLPIIGTPDLAEKRARVLKQFQAAFDGAMPGGVLKFAVTQRNKISKSRPALAFEYGLMVDDDHYVAANGQPFEAYASLDGHFLLEGKRLDDPIPWEKGVMISASAYPYRLRPQPKSNSPTTWEARAFDDAVGSALMRLFKTSSNAIAQAGITADCPAGTEYPERIDAANLLGLELGSKFSTFQSSHPGLKMACEKHADVKDARICVAANPLPHELSRVEGQRITELAISVEEGDKVTGVVARLAQSAFEPIKQIYFARYGRSDAPTDSPDLQWQSKGDQQLELKKFASGTQVYLGKDKVLLDYHLRRKYQLGRPY